MIPVVNDRHKYIFLYSAKVACSSVRRIYLELHKDEMSAEEQAALDKYHNLNMIHPYDDAKDYSKYYTFLITRNPYSRIVSAFLDQYIYTRGPLVDDMINEYGDGVEPQTFLEFLQFLKQVPDKERDSHFQTQACFPNMARIVTTKSLPYKWLNQKPIDAFGLRYVGDVSNLNQHLKNVYSKIFRNNKKMRERAMSVIDQAKKSNSVFYSEEDFPNAATMSIADIDALIFAPKPQDFYRDTRVVELVQDIFKLDFELFGYDMNDIPNKSASKEINEVPDDLDWEMYIRLNPDLPPDLIYNERSVVRHYLEFGRYEQHSRAFKMEAPEGFEWKRYLDLYADLRAAGIDTEEAALEHYLSYGIRENRTF